MQLRPVRLLRFAAVALVGAAVASCGAVPRSGGLTFSGSAVGREAELLREQLARFTAASGVEVEIRATPDAADQRHQLYVQWLNARSREPDVLQIDVIWTPELAAAGWLLALDRFAPEVEGFLPAGIEANRWQGVLYALPWFVDVGMLYWRTDLLARAPASFEEMEAFARAALEEPGVRHGVVWQGARYEGLVTVFLEHLGGFGGRILDHRGRVVVDSEASIAALEWMREAIHREGIVPEAALTWHEEETRFAFQNGAAAMMRNWPYAQPLVDGPGSSVAGRVGVAAMPAVPGAGEPTAALGGSQLAINRHSEEPAAAWALIEFLTAPEQMLERARAIGQLPARTALYEEGAGLQSPLGVSPRAAREIVAAARPRPVTPVYTQLSEILQIALHRALTGQAEPRRALEDAAARMRALLARVGLAGERTIAEGTELLDDRTGPDAVP